MDKREHLLRLFETFMSFPALLGNFKSAANDDSAKELRKALHNIQDMLVARQSSAIQGKSYIMPRVRKFAYQVQEYGFLRC